MFYKKSVAPRVDHTTHGRLESDKDNGNVRKLTQRYTVFSSATRYSNRYWV